MRNILRVWYAPQTVQWCSIEPFGYSILPLIVWDCCPFLCSTIFHEGLYCCVYLFARLFECTNMRVVPIHVMKSSNSFSTASATSAFVRIQMNKVYLHVTSVNVARYFSPFVPGGCTGPPTSVCGGLDMPRLFSSVYVSVWPLHG